jgi:hypothetical protein
MKVRFGIVIGFVLVFAMVGMGFGKTYDGKKILFIDSYHEGCACSDGITSGVELKVIRMDTKRNAGDVFKKEAAFKAKAVIESFKPDVVIAVGDNDSKYLIMAYYKDADLPFVFCGVNWDAGDYGYPYKNATGMVEITPIPQIIAQLRACAKGDRIGFLAPDILTAHKEVDNYRKVFGYDVTNYFAKYFGDWKKGFSELQGKVHNGERPQHKMGHFPPPSIAADARVMANAVRV